MIWATVSSWSCVWWLYRVSLSLTAKDIINLILVLTIWRCPCLLLCCWKRVFAVTSAFSWQNSVSLWPASFCTARPNLPVTPGISWLPTFAFQCPRVKRTPFGVLVLEGFVSHHRTIQLQHLSINCWDTDLDYHDKNGLPWKRTEIILSFLRLHSSTAFQTLLLTMMATPFHLRDSCPQ